MFRGLFGADHATDVAERVDRFSYRTRYGGGLSVLAACGTADRHGGVAEAWPRCMLQTNAGEAEQL